MHRWRYPSLSIHGIEGAFSEVGAKTVIPKKVIGKFSIRLVPNQEPEKVEKLVLDYLAKKWAERGSPNKFRVCTSTAVICSHRSLVFINYFENVLQAYNLHGGRTWSSDPTHPHYQAAIKATQHVYKVEPDLTREGGSIPVTITLQVISISRN